MRVAACRGDAGEFYAAFLFELNFNVVALCEVAFIGYLLRCDYQSGLRRRKGNRCADCFQK